MRTKIIYEDAHVLVCHKPAGLATQSGHIGQADMVSELKKYLAVALRNGTLQGNATGGVKGAEPYLGIVHRLDQPVEGLLVFGKTKEAAAKLTAQLSKGSLNKQYYAVVCGKPITNAGELVDYLVKDKDVARVSEENGDGAKKAVLQYRLVQETEINNGQTASLLDVHIDTGRFHQIRVQMAHAGHPILGDGKYGSEQSMALSKELGIHCVALYAYQVEFLHPASGKKLKFQIEPKLPAGFGNIS